MPAERWVADVRRSFSHHLGSSCLSPLHMSARWTSSMCRWRCMAFGMDVRVLCCDDTGEPRGLVCAMVKAEFGLGRSRGGFAAAVAPASSQWQQPDLRGTTIPGRACYTPQSMDINIRTWGGQAPYVLLPQQSRFGAVTTQGKLLFDNDVRGPEDGGTSSIGSPAR